MEFLLQPALLQTTALPARTAQIEAAYPILLDLCLPLSNTVQPNPSSNLHPGHTEAIYPLL